jgi:hypothetical protein
MRRILIVLSLVALAAGLGGCSKCGFFWDGYRACKADAPDAR